METLTSKLNEFLQSINLILPSTKQITSVTEEMTELEKEEVLNKGLSRLINQIVSNRYSRAMCFEIFLSTNFFNVSNHDFFTHSEATTSLWVQLVYCMGINDLFSTSHISHFCSIFLQRLMVVCAKVEEPGFPEYPGGLPKTPSMSGGLLVFTSFFEFFPHFIYFWNCITNLPSEKNVKIYICTVLTNHFLEESDSLLETFFSLHKGEFKKFVMQELTLILQLDHRVHAYHEAFLKFLTVVTHRRELCDNWDEVDTLILEGGFRTIACLAEWEENAEEGASVGDSLKRGSLEDSKSYEHLVVRSILNLAGSTFADRHNQLRILVNLNWIGILNYFYSYQSQSMREASSSSLMLLALNCPEAHLVITNYVRDEVVWRKKSCKPPEVLRQEILVRT